jgi:hypothetical protein
MAKRKRQQIMRSPSFRWLPFLKRVSRDLLKDIRIREDLPSDVLASAWLGYNGASEQEIGELEKRLGKRLPPSYRSFLSVTNGWRQCGPFIDKLWACSEVRWFRERHQDWIDAYLHPEKSGIQIVWPEGQEPQEPPPMTDEEYLTYDDKQDSCRFRTEYLQTALEISDCGDSAILLLTPGTIDEAGEWEAWLFANWMPGAHRYRSFRELMQGEHHSFCQLRKELGPSKSKYGNAAQRVARKGEATRAMAMLRKLAARGDDSSAVSLAELCAFRGRWDEVATNLGLVILNLQAIPNFYDDPAELIRLLARSGHETGLWKKIYKFAEAAIAAEEKKGNGQSSSVAWFKNLQTYCKRRGRPPHELIRIFGVANPVDALSEAGRRAHYERGVADEYTSRLKKKPAEYACARFALARNMKLDDEMIRLYEQLPEAFFFYDALDVSRAYMRRHDEVRAWEVLRARMYQSVGGFPAQVAPIILLIDDDLRPLMTRERCEFVLSTPRGWEAEKNRGLSGDAP